ncbi:hypothetical protein MCUN1_003346 [Malassezia cuniculi]|uniref:Mediator of RNA polymerase II transcription subunit 19 n=1 Tax=Malassezia cuniculi TaxID=948313 RepID=A0AAF0EXD5_9BASI|nr:hypothetical protein MCUN1_003346 [Malassezia cuniculi]
MTSTNDGSPFYPAPLRVPPELPPYHMNGTEDMFDLFGLMPLYDRAVRPYLRPEVDDATSPRDAPKRVPLPKTYMHYVADMPGKVRPPKRVGAARNQKELSELLMKPEYAYTPIVPFDQEVLQGAFAVEAGAVSGIDTTQLEADEQDSPNGKKKRPNEQADAAPKKRVVVIKKKNA